jgi:hypothetical protein
MSNFQCHSSTYPVSEILGWKQENRLELRPDFQRKAVWSPAAKVLLIDSVLTGVPIPKVLLKGELRGTQTYRIVIDGQQRISTILSFIANDFALNRPYDGEYKRLKFSQLPDAAKQKILNYRIDVNEIRDATDDEIREIYHRLNKYTFSLTAQEMRRADFPGDFLDMAEKLAQLEFFEDSRIFTRASSKRMADVEFVSELLVLLLDGPQDKKVSLDDFYVNFATWENNHKQATEEKFLQIISDISLIFSSELILPKSRFRQKADFYGLFGVIRNLRSAGGELTPSDNLGNIREDIRLLDYHIEPKSEIPLFSEYAIRCTSDANSASSRRWRIGFLGNFVRGSYFKEPPPVATSNMFFEIWRDIEFSSIFCPSDTRCAKTDAVIDWDNPTKYVIAWLPEESTFHFSNSVIVDISAISPSDGYQISKPDLD